MSELTINRYPVAYFPDKPLDKLSDKPPDKPKVIQQHPVVSYSAGRETMETGRYYKDQNFFQTKFSQNIDQVLTYNKECKADDQRLKNTGALIDLYA